MKHWRTLSTQAAKRHLTLNRKARAKANRGGAVIDRQRLSKLVIARPSRAFLVANRELASSAAQYATVHRLSA